MVLESLFVVFMDVSITCRVHAYCIILVTIPKIWSNKNMTGSSVFTSREHSGALLYDFSMMVTLSNSNKQRI
jgi:hypothetical protein